jgi:hypothetical protein
MSKPATPDPRMYALRARQYKADRATLSAIVANDMEGALVAGDKAERIAMEVEAMCATIDREKDATMGISWPQMPHGLKMP